MLKWEFNAKPQTLADLSTMADRLFLYAHVANRGRNERYGEANIPF